MASALRHGDCSFILGQFPREPPLCLAALDERRYHQSVTTQRCAMWTVRTPYQLNQVFRFGEFEFIVRAGELRRNGEVLRLQYQPLRVLQVLLEYSGDVVTRDEIRERVWPEDSARDCDNSLRVAVAKLRQAFGDDPENPQYIETLPRRGYRWLYPVTVFEAPTNITGAELRVQDVWGSPPLDGGLPAQAPITSVSLKSSRRTVLIRRIVLSTLLWIAVFGAIWFLRTQPDIPNPKVLPLTTYPGLEYMPSLS